MRPTQRSTLTDANAHRSNGVFSDLFAEMVGRLQRGLRRVVGDSVYLIDSTSVRLTNQSAGWARYSAGVFGAKAHIIDDPDADTPIYAAVTAARDMLIEKGATYVFDLGYYDYGWWAKMDAAGCHVVTRFKKNTPLTVTADGNTLSNRIGYLPQRQATSRQSAIRKLVREVMVKIRTGKILRIFSNDLEMKAEDVTDLYTRRWTIELFIVGSSRHSKLGTSLAPARMPFASRSRWP